MSESFVMMDRHGFAYLGAFAETIKEIDETMELLPTETKKVEKNPLRQSVFPSIPACKPIREVDAPKKDRGEKFLGQFTKICGAPVF